jgi:two-component system sensor histidine kinase CpxA
MRPRFSLFTRILLWFFLNLVVLGAVLFLFFNLQFRLRPESPLVGDSGNQIENIARLLVIEMYGKGREERDAIAQRYADRHQVAFLLYDNSGELLAGKATGAPAEVLEHVMRPPNQPPPGNRPDNRPPPPPDRPDDRPPPPLNGLPSDRPPPQHPPIFTMKTSNPTLYWMGVRVPFFDKDRGESRRTTLLVASDSITGHGLFFNPKPWLIAAVIVLALSILLWLPFVRGITRAIKQMTTAAEQIAEEHFDARVDERRTDEIGRLGKAINHLAARLSGFVHGQKRFLGDVSHELNSPLGRLQVALGILEERVDPAQCGYVADAQEEVRLMSNLVSELLAYAKAGIRTAEVKLQPLTLRPLVERVIAREATEAETIVEVDESLAVLAQPELLARALANVIRNAVRYAGEAGPIVVSASREEGQVRMSIADRGAGVPAESLDKLFDPFYRPESHRARATGGAGLGLAIVKSCVESCQGAVSARNRQPQGFEILITLKADL